MRTVNLKISDTVELNDKDLAMIVASTLYEKGKLSLGQAAELAGLTKRTFAELLGKFDVSIFNFPPSDLKSDVKMPKIQFTHSAFQQFLPLILNTHQ